MKNRKAYIWLLGILAIVLLYFSLYLIWNYSSWISEKWEYLNKLFSNHKGIHNLLHSTGPFSFAVFTLLQALQVIIAIIPGEATGFIGGYLYGTVLGFLLSMLGLTLGSYVAFKLARILGMPLVRRIVSKTTLEKFHAFMEGKGMMVTFLLFLLPGFPKDSLCYILGISQMELSTFLIISIIGRTPGTLMLVMQGASLRANHFILFLFLISLTALASFIAYRYRLRIELWLKEKIKSH